MPLAEAVKYVAAAYAAVLVGLVVYLVSVIVQLRKITGGLDEVISHVGEIVQKSGWRVAIFSGDFDAMCPFIATQKFVNCLALPLKSAYRSWRVHNQVAGLRGAAHEVEDSLAGLDVLGDKCLHPGIFLRGLKSRAAGCGRAHRRRYRQHRGPRAKREEPRSHDRYLASRCRTASGGPHQDVAGTEGE